MNYLTRLFPRKSQPITICRAYSDRKISKRDSSVVPILIVLGKSVKLKFTGKMNENYYTICFVVGFILCAVFGLTLKDQVSLAWGGWLYMVTAAVGIALCNIEKLAKNKTE